jgi:hypothetical protein
MTSSADRWRKATRTISAAKRFQSYASASSGGFAASTPTSPAHTPGLNEGRSGEGSDDEGYYETADEADTPKHVHARLARSDDPESGAFGDPVHGPKDGMANGHAGSSSDEEAQVDDLSKKTAGLKV